MIRRHQKRRRPSVPWEWEHVHAVRVALQWHLGAGPWLSCYVGGVPCHLLDARHDSMYPKTARNALQSLMERRGRLTFKQFEACMVALDHATHHPPPMQDESSPWNFREAAQILHVWLRDYAPI